MPSFPTYVCVYIYVSVYLLSHLFCSCLCDLCQQAVEMWPFPGMRNASRKVRLHILITYGGPGVTPHGLPLIEIGWLTSYCGHQEQPWGRDGRGGGECSAWAQYIFQSITVRRKHLLFLLYLIQDGKRKLQGYSGSRSRKGKWCPKGQTWIGGCPKVRSFCTWDRSLYHRAHA